jgi:hypothetical protein
MSVPAVLNPPTTFTAVLGQAAANKTTGTQTDRLLRDGVVPTCANPKTFPGTLPAGPITFDDFAFSNTAATPTCVQVSYKALSGNGAGIFAVAYVGSFNPANISQNWLSDAGFSPGSGSATFSFGLPAGQTLHLVFNDTMAGGSFVGQKYQFTVSNGIKFNPPTLPAAYVGELYTQKITLSGGGKGLHFTSVMGTLPPGLTFNKTTGLLSGTPTVAGTFRFTLVATDADGETNSHEYTLVVGPSRFRLLRRYNR